MGPPFVDTPGFGALSWGITSAQLVTEPPFDDPEVLKTDPGLTLPGLSGLDILVVTGEASLAAPGGAAVAEFLAGHGARAEHLPLESRGLQGNGHGLIFEANSSETVMPVIDWLERTVGE
jgi:hypothetical protein